MTARPLDTIERALADALAVVLADALPAIVDNGGPRAYSVAQVAERLGLSEATIRRLIHAGHLPTVPHLPEMRVAARALEEFLACKEEVT